MSRSSIASLIMLVVVFSTSHAPAHKFKSAKANATIYDDGRYYIKLTFDLINYMNIEFQSQEKEDVFEKIKNMQDVELESHLMSARTRFLDELQIHAAGRVVMPRDFIFPEARHMKNALPSLEGQEDHDFTIGISGKFPARTTNFTIAFPEGIGTVALVLIRPEHMVLKPGERSAAIAITPLASPRHVLHVAMRYVRIGFEHILPKGLDHILFVLGLFFLSARLKPLLWQATAFTLAHSITLALSMYGIVSLSPSIVEPLIAISIAFVACENLLTSRLRPWRPFVVFGFGLLHGLGFATVLQGFGLPGKQYVVALVSFNIGVELGQLAVILLAFIAVGWLRQQHWYRARIAIPASACIAAVGCYWALARLLF